MLKTVVNAILIAIFTLPAIANDGMYLTRGSVIYPMKETRISLDKEILSFSCTKNVAQVAIQFEFNNPEKTERKLLIGFQAPGGAGDVEIEQSAKTQITNFRIIQDGKILPYKLKAAECEECELKDLAELQFSPMEPGIFVYLFEVTFKPGINTINHSYSFPASSSVSFDEFYRYILTTGSKWSGGTIKDLTVQINMGPDKYFYVSDVFGPKAKWSITGSGKVTNKIFKYEDTCRMVRVLSGMLQINVKNLKPERNIEFGIINRNTFISIPTDYENLRNGSVAGIGELYLDPKINHSKKDLDLMRNTIYAQHGYAFSSKDLQDYFSQFDWYMPDPNLKMEQIVLTAEERKFVDEIVKKEKE
jgi:hypothetical protein